MINVDGFVPGGRFNFLRDIFWAWAEVQPEQQALLWIGPDDEEQSFTFSEMRMRAAKAAAVLSAVGVQKGDTVLIILGRDQAWWEIMLACIQIGAIASPGTTLLSAKDITFRISSTNAKAIISNVDCVENIEAALSAQRSVAKQVLVDGERPGWIDYQSAHKDAKPYDSVADTLMDDDGLCFFTSGTTGHPKIAMHAQSYPLGHLVTGRDWLKLKQGDLCWNMSDTGWAKAAWSSFFAPWMCGATIMAHMTKGFDARQSLRLLEAKPVHTLCAPPTAYRMFVQEDLEEFDFSHLQRCTAAGEPLNPEVLQVWENATGRQILDGYGQSETALLCANLEESAVKAGSMGLPVGSISMSVVDEDGNSLPDREEGDIAVAVSPKPYGLFKGYQGYSDRTSEVFRGSWYLTGDRAYRDEDGYFWFVGRADDVILSAGYRIGPFEVESALLTHPAVAECGVVASPDAVRGEVVKAFVVLAKGYAGSEQLTQELKDHVKTVTAPYKYPRRIEYLDSLPKTISGKILRKDLRSREQMAVAG